MSWLPAVTHGQSSYRVRNEENFRKDPSQDGVLLASVPEGAVVVGGEVRDGWIEVTLDGWIWAQSIEPTNREGHNRVVNAPRGENLRAAPNGELVARLANGCLLDAVDTRAGWVRVRRTGWMRGQSLEQIDAIASTGTGVTSSGGSVRSEPATLDRATVTQEVPVYRSVEGAEIGTLGPDAPVRILARSGEWVRIQADGWVRETDLKPASSDILVGVSAAEVRSRPREFEGKRVQWILQYISVQEADELRHDIPVGRRYLLTRGPLPEAGFVYVVVTDAQVAEVERLPPLTELVVIGRVRVGRSRFLGNPILELIEMAPR